MATKQADKKDETQVLKKTVKFMDKFVDRFMSLVLLIVFLLSFYALWDAYSLYQMAQDRSLLSFKPRQDAETVVEVPKGYVAWLEVDDTDIDYPIMQGIDNEEYLNKNPYGKYSLSGSIFLDYRNSKDFTDPYSLVYGHHMGQGAMFGALDDFRNEEFFNSHRSGTLYVGKEDYHLTIFAVVKTDALDSEVFNPVNNELSDSYIKENAIYLDRRPQGRLLGLSTCSSDGTTERLLVLCVINE